MDIGGSRSTPLLPAQSSSISDKLIMERMASPLSHTSQAALSRPRPEIILRWKRFALLVLLGAVLISAFTVTLWNGIPLKMVTPAEAEKKVSLYNSYSGVIMGFAESGVSQLLQYLFPVFIVYLHNLKWSSRDDPATRPISKAKKIALMLFFPIVMVAIGNSLSAVQTNQSGGDMDAVPTNTMTKATRHLMDMWSAEYPSALEASAFKTFGGVANGLDEVKDADLQRVAAGTRVVVGFPLRDWRDELSTTAPASDESVRVSARDRSSVRRVSSAVPTDTAVDLLIHGLTTFKALATDQHVDLGIPENLENLKSLGASTTPSDLLDAVSSVLRRTSVNASDIALQISREQLHSHVELQTLTLELPLATATDASLSCGRDSCISLSSDPLVRSLRPLVAASQFMPQCRRRDFSACASDEHAAFLFSSTVSSTADMYTLTLTFSKLSWSFDDSSLELCASRDRDAALSCAGLSLELAHSRRHLILHPSLVPSLPKQPLRLVQIVQPPVVSKANTLAAVTVVNAPPASAAQENNGVDHLASFLRMNRLSGDEETMAATVHATALLFLFQNALVAPSASSAAVAWHRHLAATATTTTTKEYQIYVANTHFGAISTWIGCAILFLLSALVLLLPNARARLEPPRGGNARAERFVAVQTEEVYPNLIYKKRFRIGKTGEKIKFREFAVESVTLHHKMEEDEQIEL